MLKEEAKINAPQVARQKTINEKTFFNLTDCSSLVNAQAKKAQKTAEFWPSQVWLTKEFQAKAQK